MGAKVVPLSVGAVYRGKGSKKSYSDYQNIVLASLVIVGEQEKMAFFLFSL